MNPTSIEIVCPHCATVNRVPASRLSDAPRCGSCRGALFTGHPVALDEAGFRRSLRPGSLPLLVDFWASWCGPCRTMAPEFEAAARQLEPRMRLAKVSTEDAPAVAQEFGIRSIPTMVLFVDGREAARQSGAMPARSIVNWASASLGHALER